MARSSRTLAVVILLVAAFLSLAGQAAATQLTPIALQPSHETRSGADLYAAACANCHGPDGRGSPHALVDFREPLPDFRDCAFATREPNADWLAVIHGGGPARAFARIMPAFGEALTVEEITRVLGHMRTFCDDPAWPRGELNLPRPLFTEKAFPEDEVVFTTAIAAGGTGSIANKLVYERRIGARNQFEAILPFTFTEDAASGSGWGGGIGDLTLGVKRALAHSLTRGRIFSAAAEITLPIGDETLGLSTGTPVFEPFVAFGHILPADAFVQAQAGAELPFDTATATPEAFWRVVIGQSLSQRAWGRTWSPMLELLAARELESGQSTHWDLVPQIQVTLSTRQHIMASAGIRIPLNARDERHTQFACYLLWDWFDGPLFGGW